MLFCVLFDVINELLSKGAKIKAYDPRAEINAEKIFGDKIQYVSSAYEAPVGAD